MWTLTRDSHDQWLLVSAATAIAYAVWVYYEPTLGQCNQSGTLFPIGRFLIVLAWLVGLCKYRVRSGSFRWDKFVVGAASGGLVPVLILIIITFVFDLTDESSFRKSVQPLIWVMPYAMISGLFAAFSKTLLRALLSGVVILVCQMLVDIIIWFPTSCVY